MERYKTTNDIINASHEDLIDYALEVTAERNALKAENAELHKSDASKEQSSIDYYCKFRKLKAENAELKARLEKAVELPCIIMIEQTVDENGHFINTGKAQAFNGRYGVVYIDKQKYNIPLVDICTERSYAYSAAEARLKELRGEE